MPPPTCLPTCLPVQAPPALALWEALTLLLIYLLAVPNAYPTRVRRPAPWSFAGSSEDVLLLSLLRSLAVVAAHALGAGPRLQRPYLLTAGAFAAVSTPLGLMKAVALRHSAWPRRQWPPFVAMDAFHVAFALAHLVAAQVGGGWSKRCVCWKGLQGLPPHAPALKPASRPDLCSTSRPGRAPAGSTDSAASGSPGKRESRPGCWRARWLARRRRGAPAPAPPAMMSDMMCPPSSWWTPTVVGRAAPASGCTTSLHCRR